MQNPRSILITGASSGIGAALALAYAAPGINLHLTGRDAARLDAVADRARSRGATVHTDTADVTDRAALERFIAASDAQAPLDLVIANAGISERLPGLDDLDAVTRRTFAINVEGLFNTVHPAIALMLTRKRGQVALVSSIAGFRGLPSSVAYSASKAAVRTYGEALRGRLSRHGIEVNVICPGYVRSPMTANNRFPMPFLMDAERAADIIKRKLARNVGRIAFPLPMYGLIWLVASLPSMLADRLTSRMPEK